MKKLMMVAGVAALVVMIAGCATVTREDIAKEYERVAALPPAERIHSPNKAVDDFGRLSFDLYNYCHPLLKNYVAATTNHRQYTGFMNDVQFVMKSEGLSEEDAMAKVCALVQEEDQARPEAEKVWPKIVEGWAAANALDPAKQLAEIARLLLRNHEIVVSAQALPNSFKNEDFIGQAQRAVEVGLITAQLAQTTEMLGFLGEQFRRVQKLKTYQK